MKPILYAWGTPNGLKPVLLLEELGIPYELVKVDIRAGEQKRPEYLAVNPNGKIPALVDGERHVWESGAILLYLAEKHGRFLPTEPQARLDAIAWLFWQMSGVGPMFGQAFHFRMRDEQIPYATARYADECKRLLGVMEARLAEVPYLAGAEYSIADISTFTWVRNAPRLGLDLADFPNTRRWLADIEARPAVGRMLAVTFP
ncbi:MAG: glutathione S-transferase N-terminal domain-containing protein [Pseudomonadota bacterium]|nr:glutathione S-transferase N-terminal domain-containing protein [Pseudomonadota bacterium]